MKISYIKERTSFGIIYQTGSYFSRNHRIYIYLIFVSISIIFNYKNKKSEDEIGCDGYKKYGILLYNDNVSLTKFDNIWIHYGCNSKFINMPWAYIWIYTAYQTNYGTWLVEDYKLHKLIKKTNYFNKVFDLTLGINALLKTRKDTFYYEYHYIYSKLNQESDCRYYVVERCWRPIIFKRFNIFNFKRREIEVEFKEEMGPKRGNWKGGVIGCGFNMKPGETPQECIKRMEKEYIF